MDELQLVSISELPAAASATNVVVAGLDVAQDRNVKVTQGVLLKPAMDRLDKSLRVELVGNKEYDVSV